MPFITRPGGALHYEVSEGGAQAILFVHGYGGGSDDWQPVIAMLRNQVTCVSLDLRGHGRSSGFEHGFDIESMVNDVLALVRALSLRDFVLVGHSMGTRIALEMFLRDPSNIVGLVLVDGSCVPTDPGEVRRVVNDEIDRTGYEQFAIKTFEEMIIDGLSESMRQRVLIRAKTLRKAVAIDLNVSIAVWDRDRFHRVLSKVSVPVAIVQSTSIIENDRWTRYKIDDAPRSRWLDAWRKVASADVVTIPGVGHYTMLERPRSVTDAIHSTVSRINRVDR